jgi:hypothetical protein
MNNQFTPRPLIAPRIDYEAPPTPAGFVVNYGSQTARQPFRPLAEPAPQGAVANGSGGTSARPVQRFLSDAQQQSQAVQARIAAGKVRPLIAPRIYGENSEVFGD